MDLTRFEGLRRGPRPNLSDCWDAAISVFNFLLIGKIALEDTAFITLPDTNIRVLACPKELDFHDRQSILLPKSISPLEAWRIVMSRPSVVLKVAFKVRDVISGLFDVKLIGGFSSDTPNSVLVGQKLDFFLVEYTSEDVLTLSEQDRHLDVLTCISRVENELTITSSVQTHNGFGRVYMMPVGPAHRWIVRRFLRRIHKELA